MPDEVEIELNVLVNQIGISRGVLPQPLANPGTSLNDSVVSYDVAECECVRCIVD